MAKRKKSSKSNNFKIIAILSVVVVVISLVFILSNNNQINKTTQNSVNNSVSVISDGDIIVKKDGKESKITSWNANSDPVLSPNSQKIAYLSDSEINRYEGGTLPPKSRNIWIINIDGSDPIKVTEAINYVYRDNLVWLDNSRLLFTDGEESVRVYDLSNKLTTTISGPKESTPICLDACGYTTNFHFTPDRKYLIRIGEGGTSDGEIVNLKTLEAKKIDFGNIFISTASMRIGNDSITGIRINDGYGGKLNGFASINLKTGKVNY